MRNHDVRGRSHQNPLTHHASRKIQPASPSRRHAQLNPYEEPTVLHTLIHRARIARPLELQTNEGLAKKQDYRWIWMALGTVTGLLAFVVLQ